MRAAMTSVAIAALLGATALQSGHRMPPGQVVRDMVRPFVLPTLWTRLRALPVNNDPAETIAVLRMASDLLPEWTDGVIDVAWREALDLGNEAATPVAAAEHVHHAESWLLAAVEARRTEHPHAAAELLLAAATILTVLNDDNRPAAAAYRNAEGIEPIARAGELTERALAVEDDPALSLRSAHTAVRVIAAALRSKDIDRAQVVLDAARSRFRALPDRESARRALKALDRLPLLRELSAHPESAEAFLGDPDLDEIARAILALGRG